MFESTVVLDALTLKFYLTHITIETEEENDFVKGRMAKGGTSFVWTSGRKCNFDGCHDRPDLQPTIVKGWFWSGSGVRLGYSSKEGGQGTIHILRKLGLNYDLNLAKQNYEILTSHRNRC